MNKQKIDNAWEEATVEQLKRKRLEYYKFRRRKENLPPSLPPNLSVSSSEDSKQYLFVKGKDSSQEGRCKKQ